MADDYEERSELEATAGEVLRGDDISLAINLHNPLDRAAHYIADVRGIAFDEATGRVEVLLTDEGRELVPGGMLVEPRFNRVDPGADAQFTVHIPTSIVRMVPSDPPGAEVRVEEVEIGPDMEIEVALGWSDTPFYPDPRDRAAGQSTLQNWERSRVRVTFERSAD